MSNFIERDTLSEAYLAALRDVYLHFDYSSSPRGMKIREKVDYGFKVSAPTAEPIVTLDEERNKIIADYTAKEMNLYRSCSNRVEDFAKASKFWEKLATPSGEIISAYGYLIWRKKSLGNPQHQNDMMTPWEWARTMLKKDKDTRQAVLRFSLPEHHFFTNKDFTCTMHANFLIREDKLHLTVVMRSNDVFRGLVYDAPFFVSLLDQMTEELRATYPTLQKGSYTHLAHSMHIYETDLVAVEKMLGMTPCA